MSNTIEFSVQSKIIQAHSFEAIFTNCLVSSINLSVSFDKNSLAMFISDFFELISKDYNPNSYEDTILSFTVSFDSALKVTNLELLHIGNIE